MATREEIQWVMRADVYDRAGDPVGRVGEVYLDAASDRPAWILLQSGPFHAAPALAPLLGATFGSTGIRLAVDRNQISAPAARAGDPEEPLPVERVEQLYRHYGLITEQPPQPQQTPGTAEARGGDDAMTRSEERLRVTTTPREVARLRLRKYVETEYVQVTVPVRREKVRVERVPADSDAEEAPAEEAPAEEIPAEEIPAGRSGGEPEQDLILYGERPVISTETVPVERVRLTKQTVTDTETVQEQVRKERIEADLPDQGQQRLD
jgi:stress response protein YsnF